MMPYQSFQLWEVERTRSARDRQAADVRRGELTAAVGGLLHPGILRPGGRRPRPGRTRTAGHRGR
jgi:hypothetical protein